MVDGQNTSGSAGRSSGRSSGRSALAMAGSRVAVLGWAGMPSVRPASVCSENMPPGSLACLLRLAPG